MRQHRMRDTVATVTVRRLSADAWGMQLSRLCVSLSREWRKSFGTITHIVDPHPMHIQVNEKNVKVRYVRRKHTMPNGTARWDRMKLMDVVNTEVCEQTFSHFQQYKSNIRRMHRSVAELFIFRMVQRHNEHCTERLTKGKKEPTPASAQVVTKQPKTAMMRAPFMMGRAY